MIKVKLKKPQNNNAQVSDVNPKTAASGRVHPNLIYMTRSLNCIRIHLGSTKMILRRFEGGKRKRDLEATTPLWRIELEIRNGWSTNDVLSIQRRISRQWSILQEKCTGGQSLRLKRCMRKGLEFNFR